MGLQRILNGIFFVVFLCIFLTGCARAVNRQPVVVSMPDIAPVLPSPPPPTIVSNRNFAPSRNIQKNTLIIIDPGHGGEDFGTHSLTSPKYQEKNLNMSTAQLVKENLEKMGYRPILTRSTDEFISLENRAEMANKRQSDLFVSVHYNSAPSRQAEGVEVYYYQSETDPARTKASRTLAEKILNHVIDKTDAKSRGVKHGNFAVIRETKMPAVLIEGGFLTNEDEMDKIKDPNYLKSIAWGIAQGIEEYVSKAKK